VDEANNAYITGYALGATEKSVTAKLSSAGVEEWTMIDSATYVSPYDIALDGDNNVIVYGEREYVFPWTLYITKYNNSGNQLWSTDFDAFPDFPVDALKMAIDKADNIVLLGALDTGDYWENYNYTTVKYSAGGILQWYSVYDNSNSDYSQDLLKMVTFDSHKNVIVAGYNYCDDGCDFLQVNIFKFGDDPFATTVENVSSAFNISPNPFHQFFEIELPNNEDHLTAELYNHLGQKIFTQEINGTKARIGAYDLSPGMYMVVIKKDLRIISTRKIVAG
jgi:hypothetical protein